MDVFNREAKRAARELTGDDGNFVVTTDLGNEFATLDRELPAEAVHRTKRPEDRNAIAVVEEGPGHARGPQGWPVERPLSADRFGLQRAAPRDGARRPGRRGEAAGHGVQGPPRQRRQVPAQQGPDKPPHHGSGGRGRFPSTDERGEELQPSVRRRAAAAGRGLHDRPEHRGPGDPAEAGAAGAPGQRQAAGRLTRRGRPAAVRQLDDFLAPPRPRTLRLITATLDQTGNFA